MRSSNCGKVKYEGMIFPTKQNGDLEVLEYVSAKEVVIRFIGTGYTTKCAMVNILSGTVKDRLKPSVYGVGVVGEKYPLENGKQSKEYNVWVRMLDRCYSTHVGHTYKGCSVSENFKYYPYFKDWCYKQFGFGIAGYALDKDILSKGNKIYSEDTCCFVPQEINNLFTNKKVKSNYIKTGVLFNERTKRYSVGFSKGNKTKHLGYYDNEQEASLAYTEAKEAYIKEVAEKWKDKIDPRVYEALLDWTINACCLNNKQRVNQ